MNNITYAAGLPWIWISMDISMCGYQTSAINNITYAAGLPWIWISMDISMCGYQTSAILWIYPWILCCRIW